MPDSAPNMDRMIELEDAISNFRPPYLVYDDGGGAWECAVLDEDVEDVANPLAPGGTTLKISALAGSSFGVHQHFEPGGKACKEVFIPLKGIFRVTSAEGVTWEATPGDPVSIPPGEAHSIYAVTDCVLIAASIPTARGYGRYAPDTTRPAE